MFRPVAREHSSVNIRIGRIVVADHTRDRQFTRIDEAAKHSVKEGLHAGNENLPVIRGAHYSVRTRIGRFDNIESVLRGYGQRWLRISQWWLPWRQRLMRL